MRYAYPVVFHRDENGTVLAQAPDVMGAMSVGVDRREALERVQGALLVMLAARIEDREPIPRPSKPAKGQRVAIVAPVAAAKLSVYEAMRACRMTPRSLSRRLGWTPERVGRLLDVRRRSRLEDLEAALSVLGKRLIIEVASAA
jgi:antitoxin HicB